MTRLVNLYENNIFELFMNRSKKPEGGIPKARTL